jgi:hypothetical protein
MIWNIPHVLQNAGASSKKYSLGISLAARNPLAIGMRPNDMKALILALHTRHRDTAVILLSGP